MKIESARRNLLTIAVACAVASILSTESGAKPRQGTGTHACGCMCDVTLGAGTKTFVIANFSLPSRYTCASAAGGVCNVSDPTPGGVTQQGTLRLCNDGSLNVTVPRSSPLRPPVTNPSGGLLRAVPSR
jgi:hypothetical protein